MPPADNMPDFDSMSPEELQAWMETLAERQGAVEGFTTDQRMDVDEIDPNSVEVEDNYIPYGKTAEEWAEIQERERQEKADRLAQRSATQAAQPAAPEPVAAAPTPDPEPEPAVAAAPADDGGMPDFDSMSPEELQAWMETLAERQGAVEGFTTDQRMDVAEIDPDTVEVEDNYIPYGKTPEEWAEIQERERQEKADRLAQRSAAPPPEIEETQPTFDELPSLEIDEDEQPTEFTPAASEEMDWLADLAPDQAAAGDFPELDLSSLGDDLAPAFEESVGDLGDLDLANLGADLNLDNLGGDINLDEPLDLETLDLGGLGDQETDPMDWLDGMVQEQQEEFSVGEELPSMDDLPAAEPALDEGGDPLEWLESLAKREGADADELITDASLAFDGGGSQAPTEEASPIMPGFDAVDALDQDLNADDPAAWLDSLAESQKGDARSDDEMALPTMEDSPGEEGVSTESIMADLSRGVSDPNAMKGWMDALLEEGSKRTDIPDYIDDEEDGGGESETLTPEIPDWLVEQAGNVPEEVFSEATPEAGQSADDIAADLGFGSDDDVAEPVADVPDWLADSVTVDAPASADADQMLADLDLGSAEPATEDMPDWLQSDVVEEEATPEIPDWLQDEQAQSEADDIAQVFPEGDMDIDSTDSWVEAFEMEHRAQKAGLEELPEEWLEEGVSTDAVSAAAPPEPAIPAAAAAPAANLEPETVLPHGDLEPVPDWLMEIDTPAAPTPAAAPEPVTAAPEPAAAVQSDLPDWLQDHQDNYEASDEAVPDWLSGAEVEPTDVPDWLLETVTGETPAVETPPPTPAPTPAPKASPAPVVASNIDVDSTLASGRQKMQAGDINDGLLDFEAVIRANAHLDAIVNDLTALLKDKSNKENSGIYRVLGDGLMRQGKLQQALDTYRRALNLL